MIKKFNAPRLRFPGFTDEWEQRKLEDICSYQSSSVTINDVDENGRYDLYDANSLIGKTNKGFMEKEYITIIKDGAGVGRTRILPKNTMYLGTMGAITAKSSCLEFLYQLVTSANLEKMATGSTIPHIYFKDYGKLKLYIPSIIEQEKIGKFFNNLDYVITLHQRKLNHLILKKKSLLQKLFPKNGGRYPELRFPGFTDAWEQRKLGDIATFSKGNGYSKSDLTPSGDPIILYGRLYTNYETTISNVDTFAELKDKSVISQGGEVIVPASGETAEDISRASVVKNEGIIIGGDLNVIKVNHLLDPTFLALTISNGEQQKELSKRAQGKSVVHLHNSDLQEVNLIFPLLNEQKKISTLFEKMDNIITLHQRKLNHLKLQKKALLQQLFV